jgi:hypothetical protein
MVLALRITEVLDFVHRLELYILEKRQCFRNWIRFHPQAWGGRRPLLVPQKGLTSIAGPQLALSKGSTRLGVSLRSPEDGSI